MQGPHGLIQSTDVYWSPEPGQKDICLNELRVLLAASAPGSWRTLGKDLAKAEFVEALPSSCGSREGLWSREEEGGGRELEVMGLRPRAP